MKIRSDFVSNSSSSSFMIIGDSFPQEKLHDFAMDNGYVPDPRWKPDMWSWMDFLEKKFPGLQLHHGLGENYSDEEVCIGLNYEAMKPDETRQQFEERIKGILMEVTQATPESIKVKPMLDWGES